MISQQSSPIRRRIPEWLRLKLPDSADFTRTRQLLNALRLHTVCESAQCPNHWECWSKGTATFMIGGDRCTRACKFCAVFTAKPLPLDPQEPARIAEAVQKLQLRHVVITAVARDDLADGGATHFRRTIEAVRERAPSAIVEVLVPDFQADISSIETVLAGGPHIFNHNIETVRRLTPTVRHRATYDRSLSVLQEAKSVGDKKVLTKSGMMLGLGETAEEVRQSMLDLRAVGCDLLTLGQYLQPSPDQLPVIDFVSPEQFATYKRIAEETGFVHVASSPMVRSSYHADEFSLPKSVVC